MEAQSSPPLSSLIPPQPPPHSNYPDTLDEPIPPAATKLRLMCSYGGHIVPRPHDKSLCYVGGDTRILVVDRNTSLYDLSARLSKTFLNGRPFTLKYQLPSEDLDSLISVTSDEDLYNMIDEYDRTTGNSSSVKPSRIRLFLFPTMPESLQSIGPILDSSAKSEDWFLNTLKGAGLMNGGFSESASVNCLLGLDDEVGGSNLDPGRRELDAAQPGSYGNSKNLKQGQDVHYVPDSPMLETTSSFGSTSSSPSLANLPPIRVHVDDGSGGGFRVQDHKVLGIEEQFAQLGVGVGQKQDDGFPVLSSPPPPPVPTTLSATAVGVPVSAAVVAGEFQNRVFYDDDRSEHGVPVGYRKVHTPQPQTQKSQPQVMPPQFQQKSAGGAELPSPDSVSSDGSITNPMLRPKPVIYQNQVQIQSGTTRVPSSNPVDPKVNVSDQQIRIQMQQHVQDPGYLLQQQFNQQQHQPQQQQQQFIHGTHFFHHTPGGPVPVPAYYPVYPPQQQPHPQHHQSYYVPARHALQGYNLSVQQANIGEFTTTVPSSQPQNPPNPLALVPPFRNAALPKSEMTANTYRTAASSTPQLVQFPGSQ